MSGDADLEAAQRANVNPNLLGFARLFVQLVLLSICVRTIMPEWLIPTLCVVAVFSLHYWADLRWKEPITILGAIFGLIVFSSTNAGVLIVLIALATYPILRLPLPFYGRVVLLAGLVAYVILGDLSIAPRWIHLDRKLPQPMGMSARYLIVSIYAHRMISYLYELKGEPGPLRFVDHIRYFCLAGYKPYYSPTAFGRSFYRREMHATAQGGFLQIALGVAQSGFVLGVSVFLSPRWQPPAALAQTVDVIRHGAMMGGPSLGATIVYVSFAFTLYIGVAGALNVMTGVLRLFGYDLPPIYDWFLLATSPLDTWRRTNIYWRDFMYRVFYVPTYLSLARKIPVVVNRALCIALVFAVSGVLHCQLVWALQGPAMHAPSPDYGPTLVSWSVRIVLTVGEILIGACGVELALGDRADQRGLLFEARRVIQIAAMFFINAALFSMERAPSVTAWIRIVRWWA